MAFKLILHIQNEEPVIGEVEQIPSPTDRLLMVRNPHRIDGKELTYLAENVDMVFWPVERINFIEILPDDENERIFGFVRE